MFGAGIGHPDGRGSGWTVLLVDDNEQVRTLVRMLLDRGGYDVIEAMGGEQALALSDARAGPIDLLVTDMSMPGMSGRELATAMRSRREETRVLFTSGYPDPGSPGRGGEAFLMKPFTHEELLAAAHALLREPPARREPA